MTAHIASLEQHQFFASCLRIMPKRKMPRLVEKIRSALDDIAQSEYPQMSLVDLGHLYFNQPAAEGPIEVGLQRLLIGLQPVLAHGFDHRYQLIAKALQKHLAGPQEKTAARRTPPKAREAVTESAEPARPRWRPPVIVPKLSIVQGGRP